MHGVTTTTSIFINNTKKKFYKVFSAKTTTKHDVYIIPRRPMYSISTKVMYSCCNSGVIVGGRP